MKALSNIIEKIGADRLLHFAIGALIPALALPFGIFATWLAGVGVSIAAILKETVIDEEADWVDFGWSIGGAFITIIYSVILWMGQNDYILKPWEMVTGH